MSSENRRVNMVDLNPRRIHSDRKIPDIRPEAKIPKVKPPKAENSSGGTSSCSSGK